MAQSVGKIVRIALANLPYPDNRDDSIGKVIDAIREAGISQSRRAADDGEAIAYSMVVERCSGSRC